MHTIDGISIKGSNYLSVSLFSLRPNTVTGFDLFLYPEPNHEPILYREKNVPFDTDVRDRLLASKTETLLIHASQEYEFRQYLEQNLSAILCDSTLSTHEKCDIVYTSAQWLIKDAMADPRAKEVIQRTEAMAGNMTKFIFSDEATMEQLLKVTSYDYYTYTHSVNVTLFSISLSVRLGFDEALMHRIAHGALLHDLGKSQLDISIINCKGKLDDGQWDAMKRHPVYGCEILAEQGVTDDLIMMIVRNHHEKLNGTGYPDGLVGHDIPPAVRVVTVCDVFDALTSRRSYKPSLDSFHALKLMHEEMREEIDQQYFKVFVTMMGNN